MLFVKTMLEAADKNANAITSLADSRDKMEADIQALNLKDVATHLRSLGSVRSCNQSPQRFPAKTVKAVAKPGIAVIHHAFCK